MCWSCASSIIVFGDSVSIEATERSLMGGVLINMIFIRTIRLPLFLMRLQVGCILSSVGYLPKMYKALCLSLSTEAVTATQITITIKTQQQQTQQETKDPISTCDLWMYRNGPLRAQHKCGLPQSKKRDFRRLQTCWYLGIRFPATELQGSKFLLLQSVSIWRFWMVTPTVHAATILDG